MENSHGTVSQFRPDPKLKLLDQVREVLRYQHYAYRTEQTYCQWIVRFIRFHNKTHPKNLGPREIERFLSHLVTNDQVSASTQRLALNALIFLYRNVLFIPIEDRLAPIRSNRQRRPPTVLTQEEVVRLLSQMGGKHALMAQLLYGCGLRLMECIRLRVQDIDLARGLVFVRGGKGGKDRTTVLPKKLLSALQAQLDEVTALHAMDLSVGLGSVFIPEALGRKYPNAHKELSWQWVFPAKNPSKDPRTGITRRHHVLESGLQKAVKTAASSAGITKRVGCHTLRHSFATHMLESGTSIRVLQELLGHADVKTTEIYTHVLTQDIRQLESPLDRL